MNRQVFNGKNIGERIDGTDDPDKIYGNGGDDLLIGHHGNDLVNGGSGSDTIYGGQDHDRLIGGKDADDFIFNITLAADSDVIKDFNHKTDRIGLDSEVYLNLHPGDLASANFFIGSKAHDSSDYLIFNSSTGNLYFDPDGKGGESQFLLAHLDNDARLTASDMFVI